MNNEYKLFGGFIGLLLLAGVTAQANKVGGNAAEVKDSVKTEVKVPEWVTNPF